MKTTTIEEFVGRFGDCAYWDIPYWMKERKEPMRLTGTLSDLARWFDAIMDTAEVLQSEGERNCIGLSRLILVANIGVSLLKSQTKTGFI